MHHFVATDEAGYGPNLGPLVIAATAWNAEANDCDFGDILSGVAFSNKSQLRRFEADSGQSGLMIADSKAVCSSGKLELLERGVLASAAVIHGRVPETVGELLQSFGVETKSLESCDYFDCRRKSLPLASNREVIETVAGKIRRALRSHGADLHSISVTVLLPRQFNDGAESLDNKASFLTAESLDLVKNALAKLPVRPEEGVDIRCDKHGGRSRYGSSIERYFGEPSVVTEQESQQCSRYRFNNGQASIEFRAKGEDFLPVALASMCAKYIRELYMDQWNHFWRQHVPHIKATKGYPVDAKRFKSEIATVQQRLEIADDDIWRIR